MSILATRDALRARLDLVDGVTGYRYAPLAFKPGDAWGQWRGGEPGDDGRYSTSFVDTWAVVIVLSPDPETADAWVDGHLAGLLEVLKPVLSVTGYQFTPIKSDGSQAAHNALIILGETE
jgi:hypothetical protein